MIIPLIVTTVLISFSALFSASELSLFSIPRDKFSHLKNGNSRERMVFSLLESGEKTLITILLGNTFVNIAIVGSVSSLLDGVNPILFFVLSTSILLIFGEILPKSIALSTNDTIIRYTAPIIFFLQNLFSPITKLLLLVNRKLIKLNYLFLLSSPDPFITNEEYISLLDIASEKGDINKGSIDLLKKMTFISTLPLSRVVIHRTIWKDNGIEIISENNKENVIYKGQRYSDLPWIPLSKSIGYGLELLKENRCEVALVNDEYGELYGLYSFDTIYQYIINYYSEDIDIEDGAIISGEEPIVNYLQLFDKNLLDEYPEIQSVGGLIVAAMGAIPKDGDVFKSKSYIFRIEKVEKNRIDTLKINKV